MIEIAIGILIVSILIFLLFKAIGNIVKGLLFFLLFFIIYYFLSPYLTNIGFPLQPIGNFLKAPMDKIKSIFYSLEIVAATQSKEGLVIIIKNDGILPLSNFNVKIDEKEAKITSNLNILLPKQIGALEVDWNGNYSKIEVFTKEARATFNSPL
jgi:hypothetical protein